MTRTNAVASGIAVLLATLVLASYATNRVATGRLGFYAWRAMSRKAHGGQYSGINNIRIYYETFGQGKPVLVLHGGLGSIEDMGGQIPGLADTRFVIAVDSRAHARSTDSNEPLSYAQMADDMVKLLDDLKIDRVDVVGWSDGGIVGLELAMRHPDRVGRLVAISANFDVDGLIEKPGPDEHIPPAPWFYRRNAPDPAHWPVLYRKVITMWRTQPHYTLADLATIKAPTLIVSSQFDVIKREHSAQLAKAIPDSEEFVIAGAKHSLSSVEPDDINPVILRFLDK